MSEYQYYEFLAIDRPLDKAAQEDLRSVSSRARTTAMGFTNHYNWGDLRGDPRGLMEQWFDIHVYLANCRSRRLMMRLPKRLLASQNLEPFFARLISSRCGRPATTWSSKFFPTRSSRRATGTTARR